MFSNNNNNALLSESVCFQSLPKKDAHNSFKKMLCVLYYELTRKDRDMDITELSYKISDLLESIKRNIQYVGHNQISYVIELLYLYKLIGQTRDAECGKGERELTYMMLYIWYQHYPILAIYAVKAIVGAEINDSTPETIFHIYPNERYHYGCWKDIKYLCGYIKEHSPNGENDGFIDACVVIMVEQLQKDYRKMNETLYDTTDDVKSIKNMGISLAAKWVPRENSKYGWLFKKILHEWSWRSWPYILKSPHTYYQYLSALVKCTGNFRKMISKMNKLLDTVEIKQCSRKWASIHPDAINTLTMIRNKDAFLNIRNGKERIYDEDDIDIERNRVYCSQKIQKYIYSNALFDNISMAKKNKYHNGNHDIYGSQNSILIKCSKIRNIPISYYVKKAFELLENDSVDVNEIELLNRQWREAVCCFNRIDNAIPIIDISLSLDEMNREPLYNAIALGCFICEKSSLLKRVIFVSEGTPHWVNLVECDDFMSMMKIIKPFTETICPFVNENTGSYLKSMKLILDSIISTNMSPENVKKLVVVMLQNKRIKNQHRKIKRMFIYSNGYTSYSIPYMIYWNLSTKNMEYLPAKMDKKGVAFVSGCSQSLLHHFCFVDFDFVRQMTPYEMICTILNNDRYFFMEKIFTKVLSDTVFSCY